MLDDKNKELDKLFQSKLHNNEVADNKWNVPPIDVFENALSEMEAAEPEKKRRWPFLLLFSFGFVMLSGVGFLFYQNQSKIVELDKKIELLDKAQQQQKEHAKEVAANTTAQVDNNSNVNDVSVIKQKEAVKNITSKSASKSTKKRAATNRSTLSDKTNRSILSKNNVIESSQGANNIVLQNSSTSLVLRSDENISTTTGFVKSESTDSFTSNSVENLNKTIADKGNTLTGDLSLIPTLSFQLANEFFPALPIVSNASNEAAAYSKRHKIALKPYLILGTQLTSFSTSFKNMPTMPDRAVSSKSTVGLQFGLGTIVEISNRWSADVSLAHKNIVSRSTCNQDMVYDETQEMYNSQGELVYSAEQTNLTPLLGLYQRVEIPVHENEMVDGDVIHNKSNTDIKFGLVSANIGARYKAAEFGKFNFLLNGGVGLNWILSTTNKTEMEFTHSNDMMMKKSVQNDDQGIENYYFNSAYLGAQLDYQLNKQITIGMNANMERSMESLFTTPVDDWADSKLNSLNTTIRLGYNF